MAAFFFHSIILLNGDLNNNIIKYPQQCEGTRPDLRLLSLQLMTWDWFVPMQALNYPNVSFPGSRYHVNFDDAFTMKHFLDANVKRFPIFLCGPWKEGDYSNIRRRSPESSQPHTGTAAAAALHRCAPPHLLTLALSCAVCRCSVRVLRGLSLR